MRSAKKANYAKKGCGLMSDEGLISLISLISQGGLR